MKREVKDFKRQGEFEHFNSFDNPFMIVTTRVDVTKIYNYALKHGNTYATMGYFFTKALNEVDGFKYICEDGKIYKYDVISPSYTDINENKEIGFYTVEMCEYEEFIKNFKEKKKRFLDGFKDIDNVGDGVVWLSCVPWFNFTGVVPPFKKDITIPQLIWDKFIFQDDRVYVNLMIMVHHGFLDGYSIGELVQKIENIL